MTEVLLHLYAEILELAMEQKEALQGGNLEEALKLQEKRQTVIEKIQDFDAKAKVEAVNDSLGWKSDRDMKNFSRPIRVIIEKILSLDDEIKTFICAELDSVSEKLGPVKKMKAFARNAAPLQSGGSFSISA